MNDWNEYNKGYFSSGPQDSHAGQQGQEARERDRQAQADRERYANDVGGSSPNVPWNGGGVDRTPHPGGTGTPATLWGTVRGMALTGVTLSLIYAFFVLNISALPVLVVWAVEGVAIGAAAGVGLYLIILVLRAVTGVLGYVLRIALWPAIIAGVIYFLMRAI